MEDLKKDIRTCPYCKEEVKATAIKCRHCLAHLEPEQPSHDGICPFCKEEIDPKATRCKHCKSEWGVRAGGIRTKCGCNSAHQTGGIAAGIAPLFGRSSTGQATDVHTVARKDSGSSDGWFEEVCFTIQIPTCEKIEDQSSIAGYRPPYYLCSYTPVEICIPVPVIFKTIHGDVKVGGIRPTE